MNWKQFVTDYLSFSRNDRIGLLAFSALIIVIFLLPKIVNNKSGNQPATADTAWISAVKRLETRNTDDKSSPSISAGENDHVYQYDRSVSSTAVAGSLFYFDPNTLHEAGWKKLGLKEKTIHTIQNYLSKGGHFYKPEDLKKIYGLRPNDYFRLEPYIKIESIHSQDTPSEYVNKEKDPKRFSYSSIDINIADTTAFISLPGIGGKLAARIVNFREKLGGFYSIDQIKETYGLPDSTFQKIRQYLKLENPSIKKVNINTAGIDELKAHPYIKYSLANPIISYRNEHGPFSKVEDIKKVMAVSDEVFTKISPYLATQ